MNFITWPEYPWNLLWVMPVSYALGFRIGIWLGHRWSPWGSIIPNEKEKGP